MENKKDISVYKTMYDNKDNHYVEKKTKTYMLNIFILFISLALPFIGIPIYILWKNDRPKYKIYPLIGAIINTTVFTFFFIYLLLILIISAIF